MLVINFFSSHKIKNKICTLRKNNEVEEARRKFNRKNNEVEEARRTFNSCYRIQTLLPG
jgi:hypothetical protein